MSYCRNNGEDSEVYVIGNSSALECCGCKLYKYSYECLLYSRMIKHLEEHRLRGDKVPASAFARLKKEQQEHNDKYQAKEQRKLIKNKRKTANELLEIKFYNDTKHLRKQLVEDVLEVFEDVYKRKPHRLEIEGIAKTVDISLDLHFQKLGEQ